MSVYIEPSSREREKNREMIDERKDWLVGCFGFKSPFETVFQSISGRLPKRGRKRRERIDESKSVQTTPTRTYCKCSRPLPYCNPNCRTPRHWKFTQHHCTTRPPLTREKTSKQSPPAHTASTIGPCPTLNQINRTPRPAQSHHLTTP